MVIAPFANLFSLLPRSQRVVNPNRSHKPLMKIGKRASEGGTAGTLGTSRTEASDSDFELLNLEPLNRR
jgi:hypothetical protein